MCFCFVGFFFSHPKQEQFAVTFKAVKAEKSAKSVNLKKFLMYRIKVWRLNVCVKDLGFEWNVYKVGFIEVVQQLFVSF